MTTDNRLSGPLPSYLSQLTRLEFINLVDSGLSVEPFPEGICDGPVQKEILVRCDDLVADKLPCFRCLEDIPNVVAKGV
jgi:hypothetical protein